MSSSIEKFYWSDSDETQAKIAEYQAARKAAFAACNAFVAEVGAECAFHNSEGHFCGVEFKGKTPAGWTSKHRYMKTMPEKKTAEGKALYKRAESMKIPVAKDYFLKGTIFENYWGVFVGGNSISFPTAIVAKREGNRGRVIVRCRMLPGKPTKRAKGEWSSSDTQHESTFILPDGYNEWQEWEMLKFISEFNASNDHHPRPPSTPTQK